MKKHLIAAAAGAAAIAFSSQAIAKDAPELVTCEESMGTIALVDGDIAGWSKWGLGSPRPLINQLALESGCFTPHNGSTEMPARFLVTAFAGDKEEVDQGVELAKAGAGEALLRSGAAGSVLSKVPVGGALLGAFGGFGGKKKTVAAGLRVVSPVNGQTIALGSGSVKKSSLSFSGTSGAWAQSAASASGYSGSKDGKMLTEAFVLAFNQIVAQGELLDAAPDAAAPAKPAAPAAIVAVDTVMRTAPDSTSAELRTLRVGTELIPTGKREGLFIEAADNYGTTGWVSIEDMQ